VAIVLKQTVVHVHFMLMGSVYVSELRPPTGLLFISQVISACLELRWNDIDGGREEVGEKPVPVSLCPS
jgi:hypothetical protein